jgi:hypothetical protein
MAATARRQRLLSNRCCSSVPQFGTASKPPARAQRGASTTDTCAGREQRLRRRLVVLQNCHCQVRVAVWRCAHGRVSSASVCDAPVFMRRSLPCACRLCAFLGWASVPPSLPLPFDENPVSLTSDDGHRHHRRRSSDVSASSDSKSHRRIRRRSSNGPVVHTDSVRNIDCGLVDCADLHEI